ncbi:MAG: peptide deformylase [Planctomycetes bacterium]|nr:peptide deformylase [Planctomycetota bacterium]
MKIVKYPHPALRHKSRDLTMIDKQVRLYAARMLELMYEARGLGLAANQVALPFRLLVMNSTADAQQREHEHVLINPQILDRKGSMEGEEGCLSLPDLYQKVRRARTVTVQAYNLEGHALEITCSDLPSRILQHEIDHLDGVLFIDKMGTIAKLSSRGILRALESDYRRAQERGEIPPDAEILRMLAALEAGAVPPPEPPESPPPPAQGENGQPPPIL